MATYLILNLVFIGLILILFRIRSIPHRRAAYYTTLGLLLLTAIFDNLLIYFDIVAYNSSKLLGVSIVFAPIEDFFYVILAVLLIPAIWQKLGGKHDP